MPTNLDAYPASTPPRQCVALDPTGDGLCGRDTYDLIEMGLVTESHMWEVLVEVPVCDLHDGLKDAVSEEVNPTMGVNVADLDGDGQVLPTFRMTVTGIGT